MLAVDWQQESVAPLKTNLSISCKKSFIKIPICKNLKMSPASHTRVNVKTLNIERWQNRIQTFYLKLASVCVSPSL